MKCIRLVLSILTILPMVMQNAYAQYQIGINDPSSLVRVGMDPHPTDSTDITLAYTLLGALENNNIDSIAFVRDLWHEKAIANSTKDKAYSSLDYLLSRYLHILSGKEDLKQDILTEDLYSYFMGDDCTHLKNYLVLKYELNNYRPRSVKEYILQRTFYEDFLMFNDPNREQ